MSTGATHGSVSQRNSAKAGPSTRSYVTSLDELLGAHPDTLRTLFAGGQATELHDIGESPRGRLLASEQARDVNALARPIVQALAKPLPWRGKVLRADGTGANVVFGREVAAFSWSIEPSALDGEPAFVLSYASQPWPLRALHDELRTVADGIAIGPIVVRTPAGPVVIGWFGLERASV